MEKGIKLDIPNNFPKTAFAGKYAIREMGKKKVKIILKTLGKMFVGYFP